MDVLPPLAFLQRLSRQFVRDKDWKREATAQTNLAVEESNRFRGTESKLLENALSLIFYLGLYPRVYDR